MFFEYAEQLILTRESGSIYSDKNKIHISFAFPDLACKIVGCNIFGIIGQIDKIKFIDRHQTVFSNRFEPLSSGPMIQNLPGFGNKSSAEADFLGRVRTKQSAHGASTNAVAQKRIKKIAQRLRITAFAQQAEPERQTFIYCAAGKSASELICNLSDTGIFAIISLSIFKADPAVFVYFRFPPRCCHSFL